MRKRTLMLAGTAAACLAAAAAAGMTTIEKKRTMAKLTQSIHMHLMGFEEVRPGLEGKELDKAIKALRKIEKQLKAIVPEKEVKTMEQRFAGLIRKSAEGAAKGNLGALRSAASIHYGDTEGNYPDVLADLAPKYLKEIPSIEVGGHPATNSVTLVDRIEGSDELSMVPHLKDTGGWAYVSDKSGAMWGSIVVDCTHTDTKGRLWYKY